MLRLAFFEEGPEQHACQCKQARSSSNVQGA
jgi:hypothetical protein